MSNKLILFLVMIAGVFGYTVYEATNLEKKFEGASGPNTGTFLSLYPENSKLFHFESQKKFVYREFVGEGEFLFVHFWATWCAPCEIEFPELVELINILKSNSKVKFVLVAVNDDIVKVKKFLAKYKLDYQKIQQQLLILEDKGTEYNKFGTYKLPETLLFDSEKKTVRKFTGQQAWSQRYLVDYFNSL